ncbi:MAG: hypothetical protein ABIZ80_15235 [Bryobacteraceae bacterium]
MAPVWVGLAFAQPPAEPAPHGAESSQHGAPAEHAAAEHKEGGHGGGEHGEGGRDLTMWKWANFAILAAGLGFLIAKNAPPFFASRSREIRLGIEEAQRLKEDAEARSAKMDFRLAAISREVEALRKSAREEAAQEGERIRTETKRELAKIQSQTDQEIASTLKAAQMELRAYSANLALEMAREQIKAQMNPAVQDTLVNGFLSDLERHNVGGGTRDQGTTQ